jgi:hypothetical protein
VRTAAPAPGAAPPRVGRGPSVPFATRESYLRSPMRVLLVSSEHGLGGLGISVGRLGRLLAREHEVTVIHAYEDAAPVAGEDDPPTLRHVVVQPSQLPPVAFTCDDHARSAAVAAAI